jgi:predicted RNA-binding protein
MTSYHIITEETIKHLDGTTRKARHSEISSDDYDDILELASGGGDTINEDVVCVVKVSSDGKKVWHVLPEELQSDLNDLNEQKAEEEKHNADLASMHGRI